MKSKVCVKIEFTQVTVFTGKQYLLSKMLQQVQQLYAGLRATWTEEYQPGIISISSLVFARSGVG